MSEGSAPWIPRGRGNPKRGPRRKRQDLERNANNKRQKGLEGRKTGMKSDKTADEVLARQSWQQPQQRCLVGRVHHEREQWPHQRERQQLAGPPPPTHNKARESTLFALRLNLEHHSRRLTCAGAARRQRNAVKQEHETVVSRSFDSNRASSSRTAAVGSGVPHLANHARRAA